MKVNLPLLKLIIRLLLLLIMFIVLFLISAVLYSARYWQDIYNYANANITITHIPTLSELNPPEDVELTTETLLTTTETYDTTETTTDYLNIEDFFNEDQFLEVQHRYERDTEREESHTDGEKKPVLIDGFFDYAYDGRHVDLHNDVVKESKLNTDNIKDVEIIGEEDNSVVHSADIKTNFTTCLGTSDVVTDVIGPWIAAIFIRNSTSDQFDYICDGAILDSKIIVTAARCITRDNTSVDVNDILVIVGKKSLQARGDNEAVYRVQKLKTHNNFSAEDNSNDLAVIYTDGDIVLNSDVQYACLQDDGVDEVEDALTTGWKVSGDLAAIYFEEDFEGCKQPSSDNIICNSYKEGETCPSHGSIYLVRSGDVWYLRGIRSSDPTQRGLCFDRSVQYTDLLKYRDWFRE